MPQPYNVKTSSNQPDMSKVKVKPKTLMSQMYPKGKSAIAKGGVKHYDDALQGTKRPLF